MIGVLKPTRPPWSARSATRPARRRPAALPRAARSRAPRPVHPAGDGRRDQRQRAPPVARPFHPHPHGVHEWRDQQRSYTESSSRQDVPYINQKFGFFKKYSSFPKKLYHPIFIMTLSYIHFSHANTFRKTYTAFRKTHSTFRMVISAFRKT